jgi:multiple sugar transport system permease protein
MLKLTKKTVTKITLYAVAFSIGILWIIPFLGVFMASIRPFDEIYRGWWILSPLNISFSNYFDAWNDPTYPLSRGFLNSFVVAIPSTLIPLFVGALAGYAFARFPMRLGFWLRSHGFSFQLGSHRFSLPKRDHRIVLQLGSYLFLAVVLLMALPQQSVIIPLFQTMNSLGLIDNYLSLILVHSAWGLPWIILFLRNFFSTLPIEVEEAARIDGASDFKIFWRIVLPMSLPALASVVVLQFMWVWNDFFLAKVFIYDESLLLATQRVEYIGRSVYRFNPGALTAASILVMVVPILIFVLLQRYYVRGMVGWAVKG